MKPSYVLLVIVVLVTFLSIIQVANAESTIAPTLQNDLKISADNGAWYWSDVAFDGTNYLVVWQTYGAGISGQFISMSGAQVGQSFEVAQAQARNPSVAFNGINYLIVWSDDFGTAGSNGIVGKLITPQGDIGSPIVICNADNTQAEPAVAANANGDFLVVWDDNRLNDKLCHVYGQRLSSSGSLTGQNFRIGRLEKSEFDPSIASDGSGYLITWMEETYSNAGDWDIYAARVSASGDVLDPSGIAVCTVPGIQGSSWMKDGISFNGENYLIAWRDRRNGRDDMYVARVSQDGVLLDGPAGTSGTLVGTNCDLGVRVASVGTNWLVAWVNNGAKGVRVNPSGVLLDTIPIALSKTTSYGCYVGLAGNGTNFLITWNAGSSSSGKTIYGQIISAAADTTPPATVCTLAGTPGNGGWYKSDVAVTLSATDIGSGVAGREYSPDGTSWATYTVPLSYGEGMHTLYYRSVDVAGNIETAKSMVINVDKTAPAITTSRTPGPTSNGWNNVPVTVTFNVADSGSGVDGSALYSQTFGECAGQSSTYTATDLAGNAATASVDNINVDLTPPAIAYDRTPANAFGWNNGDVAVHFEASDGLSGLKTLNTEDVVISAEGSNLQVIRTAEDMAGNTAVATVDGINIDRTAPIMSYARTPANQYGWNNVPVTVTFQGEDALSGLAAVTDPATLAGEGVKQQVEGSATDKAGNVAGIQVDNINIDLTAPVINGAATTAPNTNGWYSGIVTVHFTATDSLSGLAELTPDAIIDTEGTGLTAQGIATDKAGNSAGCTISGINIDKTALALSTVNIPMEPALINTAISANFTYVELNGDRAIWNWGDGTPAVETSLRALSDLTARASHVYTKPGVYVITVTAIDLAGNQGTASPSYYVVVYDPNGGFVTGGGWINSPAGACSADTSLTGKATFGFVSKYQKGTNVPTGDTEFQFKAGNLNFKSESYEWLVITGAKAQFKGSGTINDTGSYRFILTAIDGDTLGKGKSDTFRIRIWDESAGGIVYDNQMYAPDSADPTTILGGGSVVVHKG